MNALDKRVEATLDKIVMKKPLTSEICYFQGILDDQYINVIRTLQDEVRMKLKIIVINEDMRKYMKTSYPKLHKPYNKENEKLSLEEIESPRDLDSEEELIESEQENSEKAISQIYKLNQGCT